MSKPVLVVLAAGMGSRYGGLKQIDPVGPGGEAILDYSLYDARRAGFETAVIIIKHEIEADFKATVGARLAGSGMDIRYAYQQLDMLPAGFAVPAGRQKPWGTAHAVLCAADAIGGAPFAVINADDYYGKEAFLLVHDYLVNHQGEYDYCMAGYQILNTLSENGGVTRGVCKLAQNDELISIKESYHVRLENDVIVSDNNNDIQKNDIVSMNFFGFQPSIIDELEKEFSIFLQQLEKDDISSEFLLPKVVSKMIEEKGIKVKVLKTNDKWFGITYAEDKEKVKQEIKKLYKKGIY